MDTEFMRNYNVVLDLPKDFERTTIPGLLEVPIESARFMLGDSSSWEVKGNAIIVLNDIVHEGTLYIGSNGRWFLTTINGTCPVGGSDGSLPQYLLVDAPLYQTTSKDPSLSLEKWLDLGTYCEIVDGDFDPQNPPVGEPSHYKDTVLNYMPKPKQISRFDDLVS
jgi:hypothetical protein